MTEAAVATAPTMPSVAPPPAVPPAIAVPLLYRVRDPLPRVAPDTVGVLFVHGMGSQSRGDTLREMASPLIDWLHEWHRERANGFRMLASNISPDPWDEMPPHSVLHLPSYEGSLSQTWLLTEAWWAARVRSPSYWTMLLWVIRLLARELRRRSEAVIASFPDAWEAIGAGKKYPLPQRLERFVARSIDGLNSLLLALAYFALAFWGLLPIALLLAIVRLPIPFLRSNVFAPIERLLVEDLGDVYTYLYDDLQATQIRGSVHKALRWLMDEQRCERVVVIAHSQGSVVAVDALGSPELPEHVRSRVRLVTVGQALNIAWGAGSSQGKTARRIPLYLDDISWFDIWAEFDYANGEPLRRMGPEVARPDGRVSYGSLRVANEKNILTEHSSYFTNHEQVTLGLAAQIELRAPGASSRFRPPDNSAWESLLLQRRSRITAISGLGFVGTSSFIVAFFQRYWDGGLAADAAAVWGLVDLIPGATAVLWLPQWLLGTLAGGLGLLVHWLLDLGRAHQPGLVQGFETFGFGVQELTVLGLYASIAVPFFAIPFGAGFMALFVLTVRYWHRLASLRAARPAAEKPKKWLSKTLRPWFDVTRFAVCFAYVALGYIVIVDLPALPVIFAAIRAGMK